MKEILDNIINSCYKITIQDIFKFFFCLLITYEIHLTRVHIELPNGYDYSVSSAISNLPEEFAKKFRR